MLEYVGFLVLVFIYSNASLRSSGTSVILFYFESNVEFLVAVSFMTLTN